MSYFNETNKRILFAFYDPNSQSLFPGWLLRNYLALLSFNKYFTNKKKLLKLVNKLNLIFYSKNQSRKTVEILSFRDRYKNGVRTVDHSLVFEIELNHIDDVTTTQLTTTGWERNEKNQLIPKIVKINT